MTSTEKTIQGRSEVSAIHVPYATALDAPSIYSSPLRYQATMPRLAPATTPKTTAMPGATGWA